MSGTYSLKLMFLIDLLGKMGGAERSLYLLAKGLEKLGHRAIICCLQGGELVKEMRQKGFRIHDLDTKKIYNFKGLKTLLRLVRLARQERVSVIISYHESSDFLGLFLSFLTRVPIVSSRRDMGFSLKPRHIWAYRLANRFFDHIATVSSAVKEMVTKSQWSRPSDITVIQNGVDSFITGDVPLEGMNGVESDDGCFNICCLANIRRIKGLEYFLDAAGLVVNRFPSARFFIVGNYNIDEAYYVDLKRRVRDLGLEKVVKFTGELIPSHVPSLLASMDISVSSSLSEGMSNALLESMLAGKPVVATAVGGNVELVHDGKTGYLVPPSDPQSIAEALLKLLENPKLCRAMGENGRSRVKSEYSAGGMVERYEDLLQYVYLKRKIGK